MSERRKPYSSFCLKNGARRQKVELYDASEWGEPSGCFRLRINGRWADGRSGVHAYHSIAEIATMLATALTGQEFTPDSLPPLSRGMRVSVPNGRRFAGLALRDVTFVLTESPLRDASGHWFVGVARVGGGMRLVPVEDVRVL